MEAKLKRVYAEGVAERAATSAAAQLAALAGDIAAGDEAGAGGPARPPPGGGASSGAAGEHHRGEGEEGGGEDCHISAAQADANMAALLLEMDTEGEGCVLVACQCPAWPCAYIPKSFTVYKGIHGGPFSLSRVFYMAAGFTLTKMK